MQIFRFLLLECRELKLFLNLQHGLQIVFGYLFKVKVCMIRVYLDL